MNLKFGIDFGRKAKMGLFPWINDFYKDLSAFESDTTHTFEKYSEKFGKDYLVSTLGRYWIHMGGRAIETFRKYPVLTTWASSGIRGLHDMAMNEYGYQPERNFYLNKCDLCTQVRKCLVNTNAEWR